MRKIKKKVIKKKRVPRKGSYKNSKRCSYTSKIAGKVMLDSTWELEYAKYLDENKIKWKRNLIKFPYHYRNRLCYYIPDFYLIEEDVYIEVKGYQTKRDDAKWNEFPYKLIILKKEELIELGLDIK